MHHLRFSKSPSCSLGTSSIAGKPAKSHVANKISDLDIRASLWYL